MMSVALIQSLDVFYINFFRLFRAGETFCQMACGMLASIGDFLQMGIDEIVKNMYELSDNDEDEDMATRSETCGELFHNTFPRKSLFEAFRGFQSLFGEARERAVKAIAFAKLLRKDLEVLRILVGFQRKWTNLNNKIYI